MCELFGFSSNTVTHLDDPLTLFQARGGHAADNSDGWGIAWREGGAFRLQKAPTPAAHCATYTRLAPTIASDLVIAHVRKAKHPPINHFSNTHPFLRECCGKPWVFAHNGLVPDIMHDSGMQLAGTRRPEGATDSEYAFCFLLDRIADWSQQPAGTDRWLGELAPLSELIASFGQFNFLLSDGTYLIAYGHDRLHYHEGRRDDRPVSLIASVPLTQDEPWQTFAPGELRVYRAGRLVRAAVTRPGSQPLIAAEALP
jgi:predicted glutamine amidotransferase